MELKGLKKERDDLDRHHKVDDKTILGLMQDKTTLKKANEDLKEELSNVAAVQGVLEKELADARMKDGAPN